MPFPSGPGPGLRVHQAGGVGAGQAARRTGTDLEHLPWYVAFAFFKFAAIIAGIVARSAAGGAA